MYGCACVRVCECPFPLAGYCLEPVRATATKFWQAIGRVQLEIAIPVRFANPGISEFLISGSRDPGFVKKNLDFKRDCLMEDFAILS